MSESKAAAIELVERFYAAFNDQDLDGFAAALHPQVELQTARGLRVGREEAREWARRNPGGGLEQRIVLEEVQAEERGAHAVALIRKQWWWHEAEAHGGSGPDAGHDRPMPAHDEPEAALFTFRDGLIARWQPFSDRAEALALLERLGAKS